jgi:hypothetical protein
MLKNILGRLRDKASGKAEPEIPLYVPGGRVDTTTLDTVKGGKAAPMDSTLLPDHTPPRS